MDYIRQFAANVSSDIFNPVDLFYVGATRECAVLSCGRAMSKPR